MPCGSLFWHEEVKLGMPPNGREERAARNERALIRKTIKLVNRESNWCGTAKGKLAEIATAHGFDKGAFKIFKSVYETIEKNDLDRLLNFNEVPKNSPCVIEIMFWKLKAKEPFYRFKLHYNQPDQQLDPDLKNLVKKKKLTLDN